MIAAILIAWLIADLGSGLVHWFEDRYGNPAWPWPLGPLVVAPNIEHHTDQFKLTRSGYIERNATTLVAALPFAALACWFGRWEVAAGFLWLSQANELHSWSHQKCSRPIRILQEIGLLQSPRMHARHHRRPFDQAYCTCTDYLNPILEFVEFWPRLERVIRLLTGIRPRADRERA